MTTKEYLNQISRLNRMINNKLVEIKQLKDLACGISSINFGDRVQSSPNFDKIGSKMAKIDELERELDESIDSYADIKNQIIEQILMMKSEKHKEILLDKYVNFKSISEIASDFNMTERGCKKAHKKAIEEFEEIKEQYVAQTLTVHYHM